MNLKTVIILFLLFCMIIGYAQDSSLNYRSVEPKDSVKKSYVALKYSIFSSLTYKTDFSVEMRIGKLNSVETSIGLIGAGFPGHIFNLHDDEYSGNYIKLGYKRFFKNSLDYALSGDTFFDKNQTKEYTISGSYVVLDVGYISYQSGYWHKGWTNSEEVQGLLLNILLGTQTRMGKHMIFDSYFGVGYCGNSFTGNSYQFSCLRPLYDSYFSLSLGFRLGVVI